MIQLERIDHVEVFVRDIPESIRWYGRVLGLKEVCRWDPEPVMIGAGETMLALFRAAGPPPHSDTSSILAPHWHRVAWHTDADGFTVAQRHLKECGVEFRGPIDHGRSHSIYFADPDGNPLEITYYLARSGRGTQK
jgi:catechol 2,3-dioxygenase-like lactoylglutathione lyase family enzyme